MPDISYVRRVTLSLTEEEDGLLREVVRRLQSRADGKPVTWSEALRAALRSAATGEELA
jgi:hypothetical protein